MLTAACYSPHGDAGAQGMAAVHGAELQTANPACTTPTLYLVPSMLPWTCSLEASFLLGE